MNLPLHRMEITCRALLVLCAVAGGVSAAFAQSQGASVATTSVTTAHVRFWKANFHGPTTVRATLKSAGKHPVTIELGSGGAGYSFNNYIDVPAEHVALEVFPGSAKRPLRSLQADLAPGAFATLLLSEPEKAGDPPQLEIIDDGLPATAGTSAQLRVRCFVLGLKDARISVGESLVAEFVADDAYLRMRGLKPAVYPIHTVGTATNSKSFEWNNEADFKLHRRQTLLIYPDPYGRIRPRLIEDGEAPVGTANEDGQR